jgi:tripartite-type tricarboxylate transporter receptor subunit TctC
LPDVATFLELGYDIVAEPWIGIFAPARLALPETLRILNAAIGEVLTSPEMVELPSKALSQRLRPQKNSLR